MRKGVFFAILLLLIIPTALGNSIASGLDEMVSSNDFKIVYGERGTYDDFLAATIISSQLAGEIDPSYHTFPIIAGEDTIENHATENLILVGGPCTNSISARLMDESCSDWDLESGQSFIKTLNNGNKKAIIVAGTASTDTIRAARSLKISPTGRLAESNHVEYKRSITIKEALNSIILEYATKDNLKIVTSDVKSSSDLLAALEIGRFVSSFSNSQRFPVIKNANEIKTSSSQNLIVVGGPCANSVAEDVTGQLGYNCRDWKFRDKESVIKVVESNEEIALLVAGTTSNDTLSLISTLKEFDTNTQLEKSDEVVVDHNFDIHSTLTTMLSDLPSKGITIVVGDKSKDMTNALRLKLALLRLVDVGGKIEIITDEKDLPNTNIISVGGPCINKITKEHLTTSGLTCRDWELTHSQGVIKSLSSDRLMLILAGSELESTQGVIDVLSRSDKKLLSSSSELVLEGERIVTPEERKKQRCDGFICGLKELLFEKKIESIFVPENDVDYVEYLENKDPNSNCYECFLEHQSRQYIADTVRVLGSRVADDSFEEAERRYILSKITENQDLACSTLEYYKKSLDETDSDDDKLVIYENILFVSTSCLSDREQHAYLLEVLDLSKKLGYDWKISLYQDLFAHDIVERDIQEVRIEKYLDVPVYPNKVVLGESFIEVDEEDLIGVQVERSTRDWFSFNIDKFPNAPPQIKEELGIYDIDYMEGNIVRRLTADSNARVTSLPNILVVGKKGFTGTKWYAPDETGILRFEVLPDKIQYPTTKCIKNVCLLVDTHGISSLVPKAVAKDASVVMGCGDYSGKMQAAYYLAQQGIDVIYPTDRFASDMIGYVGEGVAIGSAPVKKKGEKTIIGDQPVEIDINEKIVVQTTSARYPGQYYDAPYRYFTSLEEVSGVDFDLHVVDTPELKTTYRVIDAARELGAKVVAIRVGYDEDYPAVKGWLEESAEHRAVLFHSSGYDAGFKILTQFPAQTTWGDARPVFK